MHPQGSSASGRVRGVFLDSEALQFTVKLFRDMHVHAHPLWYQRGTSEPNRQTGNTNPPLTTTTVPDCLSWRPHRLEPSFALDGRMGV